MTLDTAGLILGALAFVLLAATIFIPDTWWDRWHPEKPEPDERPDDKRRMPWESTE